MNNYEKKLKELELKKGDYVRANETFGSAGITKYYFNKGGIYQVTSNDMIIPSLNYYQIDQENILKIDKVYVINNYSTQELKDIIKKRERKYYLDVINHKGCILFENNEYYEILDIKEIDNRYNVSYLYLYKPTNKIEIIYDQLWNKDGFNYIKLIDKSIIDVYKELKGE